MLTSRIVLAWGLTLCACGSIDPEPPTDEDGNEIIVPGAFDTYLGVTADYGDELGVRPVVRLKFDGYIDEDQLLDFSVVSLISGGLTAGGRVRWVMSSRTLEFRPFNDLVDGFRYRPLIDASRVFSVTGAPLGPVDLPEFRVVDDEAEPDSELPIVRWAEVDRILQARCRSCHADPQWQLNPLTRESMIGRPSDQSDRLVVVPFDPGDSYLLHKLIDDFPVRQFTVQPPPWSGASPLTSSELILIEQWVATGARE